MSGTLSGVLGASYNPRGGDLVSVVVNRARGGKLIVNGFLKVDDAVSIGPAREGISYSPGFYNNVAVNLNTSGVFAMVSLKMSEAHKDNKFFARWYKECNVGSIDPATISVNTATFNHMAFLTLPTGYPTAITPMSDQDAGSQWNFIGARISMYNSVGFNLAGFGASLAVGI